METNKETITLNEMQKKIGVRDIVLVRNKNDDIGQPFLVTFANADDSFMAAIRILPSNKGKNDLIIPSEYFNSPKTAGYENGGYANVYTGLNTIRRHNVTTWISSLDNDTYVQIVYAMFCGMLGYYSSNGKFHLPTHIPLSFNININLLNALKNSGIQQKNGEIFVPQDKRQQTATPKKENKVALSTKDDDGWNSPPENAPDQLVIDYIVDDEGLIEFRVKNMKIFGIDLRKYTFFKKINKVSDGIDMYRNEFIDVIAFKKYDILPAVLKANNIDTEVDDEDVNSFIQLCEDVYEKAKKKYNEM